MSAISHIRSIIKRYQYRQSLENPFSDDLGGMNWPAIFITPTGGEVLFDTEIINSIHSLAGCLIEDKLTASNSEWIRWITEGTACAIDKHKDNLDCPETADQILAEIQSHISKYKSGMTEYEFSFACELFQGFTPNPFHIGPVCFEARHDWLDRKVTEGAISKITQRRIQCAWKGGKLRKRVPSTSSDSEQTTLQLTSEAPFICSITTNGMAHGFARLRARTIARLALASIALLWQSASKALCNMHLTEDRVYRFINELSFCNGTISSWGGRKSNIPNGQILEEDEWNGLWSRYSNHFRVTGELLETLADTTKEPQRPKTIHALTHALLWFHQGCREDEQAIAVVNFAAALDCLAIGKGQNGILKLVKTQLGISHDNPIWVRESQTADDAIKEIYDHARNAILHGRKCRSNGKIDSNPFQDWEVTRTRSEHLTRICILLCIDKAAQHFESDTPERWQVTL